MTQRYSILIVDADGDEGEMLRLTLIGDGYDAAVAAGARSALDHLRSSSTGCVVLDCDRTPIEAVRLRAMMQCDRALAHIPVVVISAQPDIAEVAERLGVRRFLRKPFDPRQLARTVADGLKTSAVRDSR